MGRARTIARRTFLVGSAVVLGGVAFGYYKVRETPANPLLDDLAAGEAALTPYVKIDSDGITLITPHVDLGQGSVSMQAALIAEELDVDFGQFNTDFGQPSAAYYNTAMADEAAPFLSTDTGFAAQSTRFAMGAMFKLMGMQATGGSSSVPDSFDKLRLAGAVARETLKKAASQRTGVEARRLRTGDGAVILPDDQRIPYTELAAEASRIDPVNDVELRDPSKWRLIGKPMLRLDVLAKSTGTQPYSIDLAVDGMVHAAVRVNPRRTAMNGYDASAAEAMRGVQKIVPVTNGLAVIADNTWRAIQAVNAIEFDWAPADYPAEMDGHWKAVEASFDEEHLDAQWRDDGEVDDALAQGDVVEAEYRAPYAAHAPLEPLSAIVRVTEAGVEVWTSHQFPRFLQRQVAEVTGHDEEQVTLHNQYAGGSFGHRLEFEYVKLGAQIANQMRGTPVKLTFSREEDFAQDFPRQIGMARGKGTVSNGKVDTVDLQIATTSASRSQMSRIGMSLPGPDMQIVAGAWNAPYAVENFRVRGYAVEGLAPTSSWRSVGASTAGFFAEAYMDELIHAAGADPMEERLRLCNHDVPRKVLEAAAELSDWGSDLGPNRGRGVALVESFGVPTAEVVEVTATEDGIRIDRVIVVADVGKVVDPVNFENQVKGGVVWGLGHAMNCEVTYTDGMAEQTNYHAHEGMRLYQCPEIVVRGLENARTVRGVGEPPVPPAAPALANAIFAATGQRIREMPFNKHIDFV